MLLRNYYNAMAIITLGNVDNQKTFTNDSLAIKTTSGTIVYPNASTGYGNRTIYPTTTLMSGFGLGNIGGNTNGYSFQNEYPSIIFGTGNTAVTFDDYMLESLYSSLSKATYSLGTPIYDADSKKWINNISFLLTNTASSSVTIKECGIAFYFGRQNILVYREVLETPFTIEAGASVTYTHTFEYQMPTIVE